MKGACEKMDKDWNEAWHTIISRPCVFDLFFPELCYWMGDLVSCWSVHEKFVMIEIALWDTCVDERKHNPSILIDRWVRVRGLPCWTPLATLQWHQSQTSKIAGGCVYGGRGGRWKEHLHRNALYAGEDDSPINRWFRTKHRTSRFRSIGYHFRRTSSSS